MQSVSAVIITFNEESTIARCIQSLLAIVAEVIVLDSNSTDNTVNIASSLGAKVYQQAFAGYVEQKNAAVALANHDWVLCLDADEALDDQLASQIAKLTLSDERIAYRMNRCTNYCGQFIRHGSWYPDTKLRLFHRAQARWGGVNPHDEVVTDSDVKTIHLPGDILHFSYNSIAEHVAQNNRFSSIAAQAMHEQGRRTTMFKIIFNPGWAFFRSYLVRLGFLDGLYGFIIAKNIAHLTFLKHAKWLQLQRSGKRIH
jgi:glycosyltransferase involved in cell wall biosynthesis